MELEDLREEIGYLFDYVENEGGERMRFDMGETSMWINAGGSAEGFNTLPKSIQKVVGPILNQNKIIIEG